ncbi:MAG: hypothetical protein M3N54_09520 [Acidobacteriota bacterium]|nr:hypothetical protein [Acidobacteriota bacterium]
MKTLTNRIALFAASAVVLGTMAYGQDRVVKAEIPFGFRTTNAKLPAGEYIVTQSTAHDGGYITVLLNRDSRQSVMVLGGPVEREASGAPVMTFQCGSEGCALASLRTSQGTTSYRVSRPRKSRDNEVAIVRVPLLTRSGD